MRSMSECPAALVMMLTSASGFGSLIKKRNFTVTMPDWLDPQLNTNINN